MVKAKPEPKEVVVKKPVSVPYELEARFRAKDEEGNMTKVFYRSKGDTVQELLNGVEFPAGILTLVNIAVTKGDVSYDVAVAPNKAQKILVGKSVVAFESVFGKF